VHLVRVIAGIALVARVAAADPTPAPEPPSEAEVRHAAAQVCASHDPHCDWVATFAPVERVSLARALAARGYELDPQPWGKVIGKILIYVEDPFAEDNWASFFNVFHFKTVQRALKDELTFSEGQLWNDDLVAESARRLHDPLYTSVVAIVPVKSSEAGKVDAFVVTRDVFSIRFNSSYTYQAAIRSLTYLNVSLSENNFLGNRDLFAVRLVMDQGAFSLGPVFIDKNLLGTHLDFRVAADEIFTRQKLDVIDQATDMTYPTNDPKGLADGGGLAEEGRDVSVQLSRPLWSLASEWGGGVTFAYSNAVQRQFYAAGLLGFDDPNSPVPIPREWRQKTTAVTANGLYQWGTDLKQRLEVGYTYTSTNISTLSTLDPLVLADFQAQVLPRTENVSSPYIHYSLFQPDYVIVRNVGTYELAEDLQLGPAFDVSIAQSIRSLGSDYTFTRPTVSAGWTFLLGDDGWIRPSAAASMRFQPFTLSDGRNVSSIDNSASAGLYFVSPGTQYLRVVAQAGIATLWNSSQNQFLSIGGDPALRGYVVNQFSGPGMGGTAQRRVNAQLELRSVGIQIPELPSLFGVLHILRVGGVVFYDVGGASDTMHDMPTSLFHDVGLGARLLVVPTSRELFRFDLAFPLQATVINGPAFEPRFVLSISSAF
jgi:hypothetical protein